MARHQDTLQQANACITRGDIEGFLAHCTEDTRWTFVGERTLQGKAAVRAYMKEAYRQPPRFDVQRLIEDGDQLAACGEITMAGEDGRVRTSTYCDVWRFVDGRMAELQAFVIEKKA